MIHKFQSRLLVFAAGLSSLAVFVVQAEEGGFIEDASVSLDTRNYYFMRDFSSLRGPDGQRVAKGQSKSEEWAQGFILNAKSGYTPGVIGFGLDAIAMLGIKLDSSPDRTNTGLLPRRASGKAPNEFSRAGVAVKLRMSNTELKVGEQMPNLPVLAFSPVRLLPPTYLGASLVSQEIKGLTLQAGQFRSGSMVNRAGRSKMSAKIGYQPKLAVDSGRFNYAGADYSFNADRTSVGIWYAQLKDIYGQRHFNVKHSQPVGDWVLGANLGVYDSQENGQRKLGKIDNRAFFSLLSAKYGGSTFYVGYQSMHGRDGMPRVFNNITPLGNEIPTYEFADPQERSWQVRHDYNFAELGVPGLMSTVRYIRGSNIKRGAGLSRGKEWERDLDLGYTVQSGVLKDLGIRIRNVRARSNNRTGIDENRLIISYSWKLL